MFSQHRCKATS